MSVNPQRSQDVYRDAGKNVLFLMLSLNRQDQTDEKAAVEETADHLQAIKRSLNVRYPDSHLRIACGISSKAWDYLFPQAPKPKELEDFTGIKGDKYDAPGTPADLFFHVRADDQSLTYEVIDEIMTFLRPVTKVVDETHGFRYFEGRAIIGFVDGTENPVDADAVEWGIIHEEDPEFENGSYAFAQKYLHQMDAWKSLSTEQQEQVIGRRKFTDLEQGDEDKNQRAHNVVSQYNRNDVEHKIIRMNVPFSDPGENVTGTYFIGYGRYWDVTKMMLTNMFTKNDLLLDYSTPVNGQVFFIPSIDTLDKIADDEY